MTPAVMKSLSRLSRESLINLCMAWSQSTQCTPYLTTNRNLFESGEEDYLHEPFETTAMLRQYYQDLQASILDNDRTTASKREIIDRIVDGDWRRGLSLYQHASVDFANLEQNDTALRWTASKLVPLTTQSSESTPSSNKRQKTGQPTMHPSYPTIDPATFVANLRSHISPLVKAHYSVHRLSRFSKLIILRLHISSSTTFDPMPSFIPRDQKDATDAARVLYIALPDSCPYVYVSLSGSTALKSLSSVSSSSNKSTNDKSAMQMKVDINTTKRIILEAIPKALSRPQERWSLEATKLTTKSLRSICLLRGNDRPGTGGGAYARFSEEYIKIDFTIGRRTIGNSEGEKQGKSNFPEAVDCPPLQIQRSQAQQCPTPPPEDSDDDDYVQDGDADNNNKNGGTDQGGRISRQKAPITALQPQVETRFGPMRGSRHAAVDRFHVNITNILAPGPYVQHQRTSNSRTASESTVRHKRKRVDTEGFDESNHSTRSGTSHSTGDQESGTGRADERDADCAAKISITFSGPDVFAGIKALALALSHSGNEDTATVPAGVCIDLDKLPAWMTGEKGVSSLTI